MADLDQNTVGNKALGRRYKILLVSPEVLLFRGNMVVKVDTGLPEDVRLVGAYYDEKRACFAMVVESNEFEEIEWGDMLPLVKNPIVREINFEMSDLLQKLVWQVDDLLRGTNDLKVKVETLGKTAYEQLRDIRGELKDVVERGG